MSESGQQQGGQQQGGQQGGQQQEDQQQQQQSPVQNLTQALTSIRKVQSMFELNYPQQGQAIQMLRNAGDLVWQEVERMQQ
ncbi:MAG TPA: hypothetical protein VFE21_03140 [Rubrobacteraceae bacterium]|nr:hypothetical protein [Rubrobacteraceae bacterium]